MTNRLGIFSILSFMIIGCVQLICADSLADSSRLTCDQPVYNFGVKLNTTDVKHSFALRNEGTAPLQIRNVQTGCGCTTTHLQSMTITPGQQTELQVQVSLFGRSGKQQKSIYVHSNDPQNPVFHLQVIGEAVTVGPEKPVTFTEGLKVEPGQISFGTIGEDDEIRRIVTIVSTNKVPLRMLSVNAPCPNLKTKVKEIEKGRRYLIEIITVPTMDIGSHQSCIQIKVEDVRVRGLEIPVSLRVVPELYFVPAKIETSREEQGKRSMPRYLCLRSRSKKMFRILSVEPPIPEVKVDIRPDKPSNTYRIRISNLTPSQMIEGKMLRIKTNLGDGKEVAVPIVPR